MNSNKIKQYLLLTALPIIVSCGKLDGEFALKSFGEEFYRRVNRQLEFSDRQKVDWIFRFNRSRGIHKIGVILLKKEIVWVDIKKRTDYIDSEKKIIYGVINNIPPGNYRISLTEVEKNNRLIENLDFMVYSNDKEGNQ